MSRGVVRLLSRPGVGWLAASLALGAAAIATLGGAGSEPSARILVARGEIPSGVRLTSESADTLLREVEVPKAAALEGVLTSPTDAIGEVVAVGLAAGEPVTRGALEGRTDVGVPPLSAGERAISVPVASPGLGVHPGARVDIVVAAQEPGVPARVVVPAAEVLALDDQDPIASARTVSLRVSAVEALNIASAAGTGAELRLLLRSGDETGVTSAAP